MGNLQGGRANALPQISTHAAITWIHYALAGSTMVPLQIPVTSKNGKQGIYMWIPRSM